MGRNGGHIEEGSRARHLGDWVDQLTAREMEVLRLAATGATDREIAETLFLSVRTVHYHMAQARRKTGTKTRLGAALSANVLQHIA